MGNKSRGRETADFFSRKGQQQALSAILLTGILIGVVGSIYLWGLPLIQKNKDISLLQNSEHFMKTLDEKIKSVANTGGRDQLKINLPAFVEIKSGPSPNEWIIEMSVDTQGTIYATGAEIPLKNATCSTTGGVWGSDETVVLCVKSVSLGENKYTTTYTLRYIPLTAGTRRFSLEISPGATKSAGTDHTIVVDSGGTSETTDPGTGITTTRTTIKIDFV